MSESVNRHQRALTTAEQQAGVLSHGQLVGFLGWTEAMIRTQLDANRWQRVHPCVYALTNGTVSIEGLWWAAHLRCGEASALTGYSALQAWGLGAHCEPIEVMVSLTASARTPNLVIRRTGMALATRSPRGLPPAVRPQFAALLVSNRLESSAVMDLITLAYQRGLFSVGQLEQAIATMPRLKHRKLITQLVAEITTGACRSARSLP